MTIHVRQAGFRVNVEPDGHLSQFSLECAVEDGLKEIIQLAIGGCFLGFHRKDLDDAGSELLSVNVNHFRLSKLVVTFLALENNCFTSVGLCSCSSLSPRCFLSSLENNCEGMGMLATSVLCAYFPSMDW